MEPMMVRAILGSHYATATSALFMRISSEVRSFIDATTGFRHWSR